MSKSVIENGEHCGSPILETDITRRTSCLLSQANDHLFLSNLFCFLRQHVEAFVSTEEEVEGEDHAARRPGDDAKNNGRVGVRCIHCARRQGKCRARGSVFYPRSIRLVYQAVRNLQRFHLLACGAMPQEAKQEFVALKSMGRSRSIRDVPKYWEDCCRRMGMHDTADGIRLQTGYFVVEVSKPALTLNMSSEERKTNAEPHKSIEADQSSMDKMAGSEVAAARAETGTRPQPVQVLSLDGGGKESKESRSIKSNPPNEESKCCRNVAGVASDGTGDCQTSCLLQQPNDQNFLSELFCFMRQHLEAFVTTEDDADGKGDSNRGQTDIVKDIGRVGLRCSHCARQQGMPRTKGAILYPQSIRLVYQTVRNWQRYHVLGCPAMPEKVKAKYITLKSGKKSRSSKDAPKYWEECCRRMGMVDTADGIRLRTGYFEDATCGRPFSFGERAAKGSVISTKRTTAKVASTRTLSSDGKGVDEGHSQSIEPDRSGKGARAWYSMAAAGAEAEAGINLPFVRTFSENEKRCDHSITRDLIDSTEDNGHHLCSFSSNACRHTVDKPQIAKEVGEVSSSSERNPIMAAPVDLCISNPDRPNQESIWTPPLEQPIHDIFKDSSDHDTLPGQSSNEAVLEKEAPNQHSIWTSPLEQPIDDIFEDMNDFGTFPGHSSNEAVLERETPNDSIWKLPLERPIDDIFEDSNNHSILPGKSSNEAVLEKVQHALHLVQALQKIRQLPPVGPFSPEEKKDEAFDVLQHEHQSQQSDDLLFLGSELYELFSGLSPYEGDADSEMAVREVLVAEGADQDGEGTHQRRKREKRHGSPEYIPLSQLGFPPMICSLVSSLLDRRISGDQHCTYESIGDVEEDLRLMASKPEIFLFQAASLDLQLAPDALYGCQEETAKLLEAYDRLVDPAGAQTKEVVLISGYSGTGKSSLVHNVRGHFIERGAYFVSGKYDAMQHLKPLSAIVSAMDNFCVLLAENTNRIHEVREAVESAIGNEGRAILSSLIPNFNKIVSFTEGLEMTRVRGGEALQQLIFTIRMLFRATCSHTHPVVLFLDDLQWADEVSLTLTQALVTDTEISGLLFIGCYRDNEVGENHPLMSHLADICCSGSVGITSIGIENLGVKSINSLLSDALHLTPRMTQSLAEAVLHKTGGNALFVVQFLSSLHDEGLLRFSLSSRHWDWDICKIREKDIADNVVELLAAKLQRMAPEVIEALKIAAAFGAQCQEELLHILDRAPERVGSTATALDIAVAEGIVNKAGLAYRFAHDQIQQAAYLLIPESERAAFHLLVGRLLWKWCTEDEVETHLFVLVDQLHRGSGLITNHDEKVELARLSLMAGEIATAMSAFLPASAYLTAGISVLDEEDWHCHRSLCLDLFNNCFETEYILGDFDAMQGHLDEVLKRGRTLQERLRAYFTLVRSMGAQGRASDAINTALTILAQLGESLPVAATEATVKEEILTTVLLLSQETEDSLLHKKTMEDAEKQDAMAFLHALLYYVFTERKSYFPVPVCRMVRLSILHGVCRESAQAFACYGMILCGVLGNYSEGYRYGQIALSLLDRFQAQEQLAKVFGSVYVLIKPWAEPIQACLPPLKRAIDVGLATGDVQHAMTAAHSYAGLALTSGQALGPLMEEMKFHSKQMIEYKQHFVRTVSKPCWQTTLNLLGRSADPTKLVGEEMDEETLLDSLEDSNHVAFLAHSYRIWLEYLFGKYQQAWKTRKKINKEMTSTSVFALFPAFCNNVFYSCLTALALAREEEKAEYNKTIAETMARMEGWAALTPWNCENKLQLMKAEYAFLKGDFILAARCYDLAVHLAVKHRFIHEQALALERSGIFHMERGDHASASSLFARARDCYIQWGACSKVSDVERLYL